MLRYLNGGESHGECMVAILEGVPSGLSVTTDVIERELKRRMFGYGRGGRMKIEKDKVRIVSGLRRGRTIGSPITFVIENKDRGIDRLPAIVNARPGHADLAGAQKYSHTDIRNVLERSSARNTVARVSVGAFARILLHEFGVDVLSHVTLIGSERAPVRDRSFASIRRKAERSQVRCADSEASKRMMDEIDDAKRHGDTLGGEFEIIAANVPTGLGSYAQWDRKIDGMIARAVMSIQAIKAVGIGRGVESGALRGSEFHDEIFYSKTRGFFRKTDNAGGIEGGVTNGEDILVRATMKPIATLKKPLASVNIKTGRPVKASVERSDVCAVPAAGVIGEAVVCFELANAMIEKFGGDSTNEMRRNYQGYVRQLRRS
ncbi:MAG: chorismate synthase, partial [Candidatus Omnitrophota bacterium]